MDAVAIDTDRDLLKVPNNLQNVPDSLTGACGTRPGVVCRMAWDISHNGTFARFADEFLAAPLAILLKIIFIVVLAVIIRRIVHRMITGLTVRTAQATLPERLRDRTKSLFDNDTTLWSERRRQRAETLGSVLRSIATVTIFGIAAIMILGELNLKIGPILASAGIIGVAVGFGAQNLVRDFLSGIFMLLEDQYGVGDVIDVGTAKGTVESVSLRTTRLRDADGVVWYIRNGEINRVGNESQGWSRAVIDVPVAYETDVARARELMKKVADELWQDPDWHEEIILEEPEVWGVEALSSDALIVRLVVKTAPDMQGKVGRELRERLKKAFDAAGITVSTIPAAK